MSDDADDDWFEDALRDEETEETTDSAAESEGEGDDDAFDDWSEGDGPDDGEPFDGSGNDTGFDDSTDAEEFGATSGTDADADEESGGESAFGDTGSGDDSPFGDTGNSSGSAFGDVGTGDDSPFGDAGDGDGGGFGDGDGGELFDDDFSDAMGGMGGDTDFEDDDFESDIPRLDLGIEGLDNMVQGGIPLRHLIVIVGGAGTGKTTFGLQFLQHGLEKEDTDCGVFITLEQTHEDIMATARERGWEFERHEAEGNLAVVDLDPVEMANSLDNIRGELPELIEDFGADRFVLDSVSLLEMMYDDVSRRRTEVFDFTQSLKDAGVTTVLTSEANEDNPYASRHGIIEYLTDAVFLLRYVRSETQETRLAVEIQKIRNANHSRETKPYEITMDGISVYEQANIF
ncbi:KaiC domain-containing protein [Halosimplex halobium]|uniref:KaiC domain-containing protein n=1 Tax=Halosimplex halobium TaxID=3396618 RepID=UPI003F560B1E